MAVCGGAVAHGALAVGHGGLAVAQSRRRAGLINCQEVRFHSQQKTSRGSQRFGHCDLAAVPAGQSAPSCRHVSARGSVKGPMLLNGKAIHCLHVRRKAQQSRRYEQFPGFGSRSRSRSHRGGHGWKTVAAAAGVSPGPLPGKLDPLNRFSHWVAYKITHSHKVASLPVTLKTPTITIFVREILVLVAVQVALRQVEQLMRYLNGIWSTYLRRDLTVTEEEFQSSGFRAVVEPFQASMLIVVISHWARLFGPMLGIDLSVGLLHMTVEVGIVFTSMWFLLKWKQSVVDVILQQPTAQGPQGTSQIVLLDKLASIVIVLLGSLVAAEAMGLKFKSLLALGGLSGIALGLAAKDVISNLFAGAVLYITRPFVIGEKIKGSRDINGVVQDIGFYQTRLINGDNLPVTVPNSLLMSMVVVNYSRAKSRSLSGSFHLRHEDILRIDEISKKIEHMIQEHPFSCGNPRATLGAVHMFGIELRLSCYIKSAKSDIFFRKQHEIFVRAAEIIEACGGKLVSLTEIPGFSTTGMATTFEGSPAGEAFSSYNSSMKR